MEITVRKFQISWIKLAHYKEYHLVKYTSKSYINQVEQASSRDNKQQHGSVKTPFL